MFLQYSRRYTKPEVALNGNMFLSEARDLCEDRLRGEKQKLQQQQEEVLKLQSVLKLHLNIKKDIKKQINQDFHNFCEERFGCIFPLLQDLSGHDTMSTVSLLLLKVIFFSKKLQIPWKFRYSSFFYVS